MTARSPATRCSQYTISWVRDEGSKHVLERVGIDTEITVAADPALLLRPAVFTRIRLLRDGIPDDVRLVGISVREPGRAAEFLDEDGYYDLLAVVSDFLVHRLDAHVVFLPMERNDLCARTRCCPA